MNNAHLQSKRRGVAVAGVYSKLSRELSHEPIIYNSPSYAETTARRPDVFKMKRPVLNSFWVRFVENSLQDESLYDLKQKRLPNRGWQI